MAVDLSRAQSLAAVLKVIKAEFPNRHSNHAAYDAALEGLSRIVTAADPKGCVKVDVQGCTIRAFGIRTTCTGGVAGAMGNYIQRVTQALTQAGIAAAEV